MISNLRTVKCSPAYYYPCCGWFLYSPRSTLKPLSRCSGPLVSAFSNKIPFPKIRVKDNTDNSKFYTKGTILQENVRQLRPCGNSLDPFSIFFFICKEIGNHYMNIHITCVLSTLPEYNRQLYTECTMYIKYNLDYCIRWLATAYCKNQL